MKRTAAALDADNTKAENAEKQKKKKMKFEKRLENKSDKATLFTKKISKENASKPKASPTKLDLVNIKKEKKELGKKHRTGKLNDFTKKTSKGNASKSADAPAKVDWTKIKSEKKQLRKKREIERWAFAPEKVLKAKEINEKMRRSSCDQNERAKLLRTLHSTLVGNYTKMIFKHDMSRIVQFMIKHSDADTRLAIFQEIKLFIVLMLNSKYAKNCVKSLLKYGSAEIKRDIISMFHGNVFKVMCSYVSAPVFEFVYTTYCTEKDKMRFKQEFYGGSYKSLSDACTNSKDIMSAILFDVKKKLVALLGKYLVESTLLHTILHEFFGVCSSEDRSELITMLRSYIVTLSKTKMGALVAAQCVWHGNTKDRKVIIKSLKTMVTTMCTHKYGHLTLLALFDSADDTVMVKKIILSEIQENLIEIVQNVYGRHVVLYLVARRDSHYFSPDILDILRRGDDNAVSKKPSDIREKELLDEIRDPLLDAVTADAATWLSSGAIAMVTLAILKVGSGEKLTAAFDAVARVVVDPDSKIIENEKEWSLIEHPGLHMMLKKLIKYDDQLRNRNETTFGEVLLPYLTLDVLKKWVSVNRGCFLINFLAKNECHEILDTLISRFEELDENWEVLSTSKNSTGKSILLKTLEK